MRKQIPNIITLSNLLCGLLAIIFLFQDQLNIALILVAVGAGFDFFDGLVARLLKVQGELGKQLDSLADMVSFGVVPGFIMLYFYHHSFDVNWNAPELMDIIVALSCLMITLLSAYRLATFNIDTRQSFGFIGLPTPANTLLIGAVVWLALNGQAPEFVSTKAFIIVFSLASSYLLISPIPLIAMKFKDFSWKNNVWRYVFLGSSIILVAALQVRAIPFVFMIYFLVSILDRNQQKEL